jgi:hypothetical protein
VLFWSARACARAREFYICPKGGGWNVRSPDLQDLVGRIEALAEKVDALRRFL